MNIDYDLHGIVGVRLLNATETEEKMITRQIGPIQTTLDREPDIIIRFVDKMPMNGRLRYLGVDEGGFTDDAFLVLRSKHKSKAKVQIPFDQLGTEQIEIVAERGLTAVPHLIAIVNLTALSRGALPMHASAFTYRNQGILATGWAKGGKTETLLSFMAKGAEHVGDEWIYISEDGQTMYGIPEPIRIWDWHLQDLPQYWDLVSASDKARLRGLDMMVQSMEKAAAHSVIGKTKPAKLMQRATPIVKRQQYVHLEPHKLFGSSMGPMKGSLDKIFLVASHEPADITVTPITAEEVAARMVFSLQDEREELMAHYRSFRFAFPERQNTLIEQAEEIQRRALNKMLAGKEAYIVYHPYPVAIPALYDAMESYV
ncbi:MAG: hypothetical protein AAF614_18180 [Chloroflexota bacterium]